jgi:hypothetical protein
MPGACAALERIAELEDLDTRWRPMRTAPKDGTVIECHHQDWPSRFWRYVPEEFERRAGWEDVITGGDVWDDPQADGWRPAHPEWNEKD